LKILELTNFSAGICGVWQRVKQEAFELSKRGYDVRVFSSNAIKGSKDLASCEENINNIQIKRFSFKKLGGESFMNWDFKKEGIEYSPDIIIAHSYRHSHTLKALKLSKELKKQGKKCKVFLVTHAPFARDSTRNFLQRLIVSLYDNFVGKFTINKFDKILIISHWEIPHLIKIGAKKDKILYLPNGIPEEFFSLKTQSKEEKKILFFGRISPIKSIETAISAIPHLNDNQIKLEIVGPAEEIYLNKLKILIENLNLQSRITFSPAIYDLKKRISKIDSSNVFILPSKSEGMPQSLIEAMARGKVVVASNIPAISDLIKDKKTGYLFDQGNEKSLAEKIDLAINNPKIGINARKSVQTFVWDKIISKLEQLF